MARYIDADKVLNNLPDDLPYKASVKRVLIQAPEEDVVEVVRCKDCKYFGKDMGYGKHDCKKYEMPYCLETDFCSYGERKGDT